MSMSVNSSLSFKGYIPVRYMVKNEDSGKYVPVIKKENIRKCHGFVVRNLNGTAKKNKNERFVEFYKSYDSDYRNNPIVTSVYDNNSPTVYMVTGSDVDVVKEFAKPIGKAKGDAKEYLGHSNSFESHIATKDYFKKVKAFLRGRCKRLKSADNKPLSLVLYFDPQFSKNDRLKGFEFRNARFLEDA